MEKSIGNKKYTTFLQLLVDTRKNAGVTQVELAEKLRTDQSTISKMERGERRMDVIELYEYCRHVNTSLSEFTNALEARLNSSTKRRIRSKK